MIERQEESQEIETLWSIAPRRRAMYLARLREVFADVLLCEDARAFIGVPPREHGCDGGDCECGYRRHVVVDSRTYADVTGDLIFTDAGVEIDADDPDELIGLLRTGLEIEPFDGHADYFTPEYVAYAAECRRAMRG